MKIDKNNRSDYTQLKRKMWIKMLLISIIPVLSVVAIRFIDLIPVEGLGDAIVEDIGDVFSIDFYSSSNIYLTIRNYVDVIFAVLLVVVFLIFSRLIINSFVAYFHEIAQTLDLITDQKDNEEISLSNELEFFENKLYKMRVNFSKREHETQKNEQRKNDLLVYSAHDIKTPLTSVMGYLILVDDDPDIPKEKRVKYIRTALDKTRLLDSMIEELFETMRYSLRDISLDKRQIDLLDILIQMKEEFYPVLNDNHKEVHIHGEEDITIYGDPEKLARVFNNILKNAITYSQSNSVIDIWLKEDKDWVTIEFKNQGEPIPNEQLIAVFKPFYRLDSARTVRHGGSGLGLAIAKEIVELHGGTIDAVGRNREITFIVRLPKSSFYD